MSNETYIKLANSISNETLEIVFDSCFENELEVYCEEQQVDQSDVYIANMYGPFTDIINDMHFDDIQEFADALENAYAPDEAIAAYIEDTGGSVQAADDAYAGTFRDLAEFAEQFIDNVYDLRDVPDLVRNNIDFDAVGYELQHDFYTYDTSDGVAFFHCF